MSLNFWEISIFYRLYWFPEEEEEEEGFCIKDIEKYSIFWVKKYEKFLFKVDLMANL